MLGIILIILSVLLSAGGIILAYKAKSDSLETIGGIAAVFGVLALCFIGASIPMERITTASDIAELKAFQDTINYARETGKLTMLERATITTQVAKWNEWAAGIQYLDNNGFDLWCPDKINELKPAR